MLFSTAKCILQKRRPGTSLLLNSYGLENLQTKKSAYYIQLHCTINWSNTLFGILIASYAMYCELLFILRVTVTVTDNFNISWYI